MPNLRSRKWTYILLEQGRHDPLKDGYENGRKYEYLAIISTFLALCFRHSDPESLVHSAVYISNYLHCIDVTFCLPTFPWWRGPWWREQEFCAGERETNNRQLQREKGERKSTPLSLPWPKRKMWKKRARTEPKSERTRDRIRLFAGFTLHSLSQLFETDP